MVVDSSAVVAVLLGEPERDDFIGLIAAADDPLISATTLVEASIVMHGRMGAQGLVHLDALLASLVVRSVAFDAEQAYLAREAFVRFGKGRHPAGLNLGDCFAYALAQAHDRPLLFKGNEFARTDVVPAA